MPSTAPKKPTNSTLARRCKYCRATFIPERMAGKEAKFCCADHRKAFWRYGGLPFDKMKVQLWKAMKRELPALVSLELSKNEGQRNGEQALRQIVRDEIGRMMKAAFGGNGVG